MLECTLSVGLLIYSNFMKNPFSMHSPNIPICSVIIIIAAAAKLVFNHDAFARTSILYPH